MTREMPRFLRCRFIEREAFEAGHGRCSRRWRIIRRRRSAARRMGVGRAARMIAVDFGVSLRALTAVTSDQIRGEIHLLDRDRLQVGLARNALADPDPT